MGLFSTVLHIYKRSQTDTVSELIKELQEDRELTKFSRLDIDGSNFEKAIQEYVYDNHGVCYLVTPQIGDWTTIVEINVKLDNPFYLYDLTNSISKRLATYALSFHLHDDDILLFNLDKEGHSIDGYNSNYQYFLTEPADKEEVISQRNLPDAFVELLPPTKTSEQLNSILNEGYWNAFDNNDLDEDGVPNDEKYFIDEQDRFERVGKYLEIYSKDDYPFADWLSNLTKLNLSDCYLLMASL
ncbi:hypothetical protein [Foetidibacter luteolus]|uniref:hypothetical protein n=1 Tax=Foetidibacter luteolus TaxID=2608880 RepID=UPI00129A934C|nr:hypothetical protein [Foetidibacter luteolus]